MKKILNFLHDSNSSDYSKTIIGENLAVSLGNDYNFMDRKDMILKDLQISINSLGYTAAASSWKTWSYIPDFIYVILENNQPSDCSYIRNDFPFFCVLELKDIVNDSFVTSSDASTGYTSTTYKYSLLSCPPKIDLSTNVCFLSFWALDKRGENMKGFDSLFLGNYSPVSGGGNVPLRKINIAQQSAANDYLKCGITINLSIEI